MTNDLRGTRVWPKTVPPLSDEQLRVRDQFMGRWLEVLPGRYQTIERFNHGYSTRRANGGCRTLELGAGVGAHLEWEDLSGQDYYALELRPDLAGVLRARHPQVTTVVGDCQEGLPFGDGFFDRVVAVHVLEHLPDLPAALDEAARVLSDDGELVVVIPCEGGLAYWLARRLSAQRMFEREFGMSYKWLIRSEHLNTPGEILGEIGKRFSISDRSFFPLRIPVVHANLVIGVTSRKLPV